VSENSEGFPDREEVLGGFPARRAETLLFLIESRAANLEARSRRLTERFLTDEDANEREFAYFEAFSQGRDPPLRPTVQDIERHAAKWGPLVAQNPTVRAAVAHRLGQRYRLAYESVPGIRAALALDDPTVRQAYRRLHGRPLEEIFATRVSPVDRLRWAWAAIASKIEHLPPFWTAYSLTLTETVGATILALPIAVATIGPLAGVAVLAVLGIVNILTVALMAEAVARSGNVRYGGGYLGRIVADYLGATGSVILSVSFFVLCLLILPVFYIGVSTSLEAVTPFPATGWSLVLFLVGLYYVRRESLNATIASALMVGAINITLVVVISILAFTHLRMDYLSYVNVPFISGRPFDPSILEVVFGVVLAAYFGHTSVGLCGRLVLRRDPSGRSLMWGCVAAQTTAMFLYALFVLAANGAIVPEELAREAGTALTPLTGEIGPVVGILGTLFVILGMGMGSIHFALALAALMRERLPAQWTAIVVLPFQKASLVLYDRRRTREGLEIRVVYLGMRDGRPEFRLDVAMDGEVYREETSPLRRWDVLPPSRDSALAARFPRVRDSNARLTLEIMDVSPYGARVRVASSLRTKVEGEWDAAGVSAADLLLLPDTESDLILWMTRRGDVTARDVASYTGDDEQVAHQTLEAMIGRGLVRRIHSEGEPLYAPRIAARRRRNLPDAIRQLPDRSDESRPRSLAVSAGPSRVRRAQRALLTRKTRFVLTALPVVVAFGVTEWMLLSEAGTFAGLLGFIGTIVVSLVAGIFPVLLLIASRRKGEHVPGTVYAFLGHPVLLGVIYVVFFLGLLLHGLFIWSDPWMRVGALVVAAAILIMTVVLLRLGAFKARLTVEVRQDDSLGKTLFAVTANGKEATCDVLLEYADGNRTLHSAEGEIPAFPSLRRALFRPRLGDGAAVVPGELKIRVHSVGSDGESEGLAGHLDVQTGDESHRFDLALSKGEVVVPVHDSARRIHIEMTRPDGDRLVPP
jgi:amino acid permease